MPKVSNSRATSRPLKADAHVVIGILAYQALQHMTSTQPAKSSTSPKRRVLFSDDHHVVLDALSYIAQDEYDVHAVDTLAALNREVDEFDPDLIVLDIRMPDGDGIEAARHLLQRRPDLKVLFLSMYSEPQLVKRALDTGAVGYLSKRAPADELMLAIRTILNGGKYVGARTDDVRENGNGADSVLTERQREVLRLIAQGCSAKEIANQLNISVRTAEFHRAAIMERLKLHSTAMMTRYAVEKGLG
jgi:DNA-binding NarL/FixJ family response regulator